MKLKKAQQSRPFTVVRIISRLNVGGPAIHAILLTDELNRRGYESLLVTGAVAPDEASMEYLAEGKLVPCIKIPELSREISWKDLVAFWKIVRILLKEKPDIVHTHAAKAGALGRIAASLCRVPFRFHTFHGHVFDGYFSPRKTRIFIAAERFLAGLCHRVLVVSSRLRDEIGLKYRIATPEKIVVVPLGIELDQFCSLAPPQQGPSEPVLLWVGRFVEVKDPLFLLMAARELRLLNVHGKFLMVGGGSLRVKLEKKIHEWNLEDRVELIGWQKSMSTWYARSHVLAVTSLNEGTPVAMIEAMSAGRPCIAPDVGGVADLMRGTPQEQPEGFAVFDNGILLRRRQPVVMAQALAYLLARPLLGQSMGACGRMFAVNSFSKERLAQDIVSIYEQLLNQGSLRECHAVAHGRASGN